MATSAFTRIGASIVVPPTQNTAPVLEFRCLYTSDLRRKQKRWQDGILKFHTFNKRVMVYDDRGNFVGDTHWREDYTFGEGEELDLERSGALVQVSECIRKRDQDLTDLLERRVKEKGERALARAVASSPVRIRLPITQTQAANLPRQDPPQQRSIKRRKQDSSTACKVGYAQTLTGATLTLSGTPSSRKPVPYESLWSQAIKKPIDTINRPGLYRGHLQYHDRRVAQGIRPEQTYDQANKSYEKSTPQQERTNCSDTLRTPFIQGRKAPTTYSPLPSLACQEEHGELIQRAPDGVAALEDDYIDVTVSTRATLLHEVPKSSRSSFCPPFMQTETLGKSLPLPLRRQMSSNDGCQEGRNLNPLRIKPRPKRKLLLSACLQTRSPLPSTKTSRGPDDTVQRPAHKERNTGTHLSEGTKRLDAFYEAQQQRLNERLRGNRSADTNECVLSSPKNGGIDHAIDVLLSRNYPEQADEADIELNERDCGAAHMKYKEPLMTVKAKGVIPMIGDGYGKELRQPTKNRGDVDVEAEKLLVIDDHNIQHTRRETEKSVTDTSKSSSPRLVRVGCSITRKVATADFVADTNEEKCVSTGTEKAASPAIENQDRIIPRCEQSLAEFTDRAQKVDQSNTTVRGSRTNESPTIAIEGGPTIYPPVLVSHYDRDADMDKGPWSREAFDLFGWNPKDTSTNLVLG